MGDYNIFEIRSYKLYNVAMHTLSIFPDLLNFGIFAPLLLRVAVGLFFFYIGLKVTKSTYGWASIFYFIAGILLLIGLYTQLVSIVGIILISFDFFINQNSPAFSVEKRILYVMVKIILISLLVTGPGFLAFDLPL